MSATNRSPRGGEGRDFFPTPAWLTESIVSELTRHIPENANVLEPCCGDGAIIRVLAEAWPDAVFTGIDIVDVPAPYIGGVDFLKTDPSPEFDLVISNPPFALAREVIEHALKFRRTKDSLVAMLLRLNFLEGQKRAPWLRALRPSVYITPRRPSFTQDGSTDATGYGWFFFDGRGELHWLETENSK